MCSGQKEPGDDPQYSSRLENLLCTGEMHGVTDLSDSQTVGNVKELLIQVKDKYIIFLED